MVLPIYAEMHTVAFAQVPSLAVSAYTILHPLPVAELLKAIIPHLYEAVLVDIALRIVAPHAETTCNVAIAADGCHMHTGYAAESVFAHLKLVFAEESLTAVLQVNLSVFPYRHNEVHHPAHIFG